MSRAPAVVAVLTGTLPALTLAMFEMTSLGAEGATPRARPRLAIPLLLRVADCSTGPGRRAQPVVSPAWIDEHLQAARRVFRPHGLDLALAREPFRPHRCELLDGAARDSLASHAGARRAVTVLVVRRIRDLALPTYDLMGVHWRYRGAERRFGGRRWVFLTRRARPPVLAHELAHFFGLPHDPRGGNLMTPGPSDAVWRRQGEKPRPFAPRLTPSQARRLRRSVQRWLERHGSSGKESASAG